MPLVGEIAAVIKALGEVVKNAREIINAVNDGRAFLAAKHPEAKQDFADLLGQMQKAIEGLADVTKVIAGFRFVIPGDTNRDTADRELARFNGYLIEQQNAVARLRGNIRDLKADCAKVGALQTKLDAMTVTGPSWGSLFGLLGEKQRQRSMELANSLHSFYGYDQGMIGLLEQTFELAMRATREVQGALGPAGSAHPQNVPEAARILGSYAEAFERPQSDLQKLADTLSETRTALIVGP